VRIGTDRRIPSAYAYFLSAIWPPQGIIRLRFSGDSEGDPEQVECVPWRQWVKEQEFRQERNPVVYRRFNLLLAMLLGSYVPVAAQTLAPQIVLRQEHIAPVMTTLQTVSIPLPAPFFLQSQDPGKSPVYFSLPFAGAYDRYDGLLHLSQMVKVKTLMFTQSSLPLVQFWSGRFQLDAFQSTLRMENMQPGPSRYGGKEGFRATRQLSLGGPLSVHFTGLSLSFHFGRDSRTRHPTQAWRRMKQFVGGVLE